MTQKNTNTEIQTIGFDDERENRSLRIGFTIAFHPDISRIGEVALLGEVGRRVKCRLSRLEPVFETLDGRRTSPLESPFVSRTPIDISIKGDTVVIQSAPELGLSLNGERCLGESHFSIDDLEEGIVLLVSDTVLLVMHYSDSSVQEYRDDLGLIGQNRKMQRLRSEILNVADLDTPVLIRGESGTGKELVASAIQAHSRREKKAFEKVNLAEIPTTIAERELFGAAEHAGTGEPGHDGYFLRADGGTLFLDEIGDVAPAVQPKLLRALETNEIQILGAKKKEKVDVRFIAGTDADLEHAVEDGSFKSSLLRRLDAYTLYLPPLRQRRDDIGGLFIHFLEQALEEVGDQRKLLSPPSGKPSWLPAAFMAKLVLYSWPGNVRELKNVAIKVAIGNRRQTYFHLNEHLEDMFSQDASGREASGIMDLDSLSDSEIVDVLVLNQFNVSETARYLNVNRTKLHRFLKSRRINVKDLSEKAKQR